MIEEGRRGEGERGSERPSSIKHKVPSILTGDTSANVIILNPISQISKGSLSPLYLASG